MLRAFIYNCIRLLVKNKEVSLPLDRNAIKRLLILRHDRLGDMVVTLPMIDILREYLPNAQIDVLASPKNYDLIKNDTRINSVYVWNGSIIDLISLRKTLRNQNYDVAICTVFFKLTSIGILMNYLLGKKVIKITQGRAKPQKQAQYLTWFNALSMVDTTNKQMVVSLFEVALDVLGLGDSNISNTISNRFKIQVNKSVEEQRLALGITDNVFVLFYNLSAGADYRELTIKQNNHIITTLLNSFPSIYIALNAVGTQSNTAINLTKLSNRVLFPNADTSIQELIDKVNCSDLVFTPDTSITHFGYALSKPTFVLCTSLSSSNQWHPYGVESVTQYSKEGTPISTMNEEEIAESLTNFISSVIAQSAQ